MPDGQGRAERFHLSLSQDEYSKKVGSLSTHLDAGEPMKHRSDFNEALTKLHHLHRE